MISADICETKVQMFYDRANGIKERVDQLMAMPDTDLRREYVMDCWRRNRTVRDEINSFQRSMNEVSDSNTSQSARWVMYTTIRLQDALTESRMKLLSYL